VQGLFIEMFLSAELVFTIFMLAAEKHKGTFIAPIGIGLSLFVAELMGVYFTGGSVNPARSFGPSVVTHQFHSYHWIYWVGPILGSLLASGFYLFIKMLEYETANPGQDRGPEGEAFNTDLVASQNNVSFAGDEYEMEEGRVASSNGHAISNGNPSNIGHPKEYGSTPRPYSDSPAPPHKNDQFSGLEAGGMHASDPANPVVAGDRGDGNDHRVATPASPSKSAMKSAGVIPGRNGSYTNGGSAHSAVANTYVNRHANSRIGNDEEFYGKE
jgi:aquaporin related protein